MIIQGTNIFLTFIFPSSIALAKDMEVLLYTASGEKLKRWGIKSDTDGSEVLSVSGDGLEVYAPLTQEQTANYPIGPCYIEVKWLNEVGETIFASPISENIVNRHDRNQLLDESGSGWGIAEQEA